MNITDARQYIQSSFIYTDSKYQWILPVIDNLLNDRLEKKDLSDTLDYIFNTKKTEEAEQRKSSDDSASINTKSSNRIKRLKSIDSIKNIGLLTIDEPISLNDGLNVFYGKNAAGKSSIYLALCKNLGKNKNIYGHVLNSSGKSYSKVTCIDENDEEKVIAWETGITNQEEDVLIFDSNISHSLIAQDQVNQFEIAHLKIEYFILLYDLVDSISNEYNERFQELISQLKSEEESLINEMPYIFNHSFDLSENNINSVELTEDEKKFLITIPKQINALESNTLWPIIKNLNTVKENILEIICTLSLDHSSQNFALKFNTQYFSDLISLHKKYLTSKKLAEELDSRRLTTLIPSTWQTNPLWLNFINASIAFVEEMDLEDKNNFTYKYCLYCQQELKDDKSKNLVHTYHEMQKEYKQELNQEKIKLDAFTRDLQGLLETIKNFDDRNKIIESEFETISFTKNAAIDRQFIQDTLQKILESVGSDSQISTNDGFIREINNLWTYILDLFHKYTSYIDKLSAELKNKNSHIETYRTQLNYLLHRQNIEKNKSRIINFLVKQKNKNEISKYGSQLITLKRCVSDLKTKFSEHSVSKEFHDKLHEEYEAFRFNVPKYWRMNLTTSGGFTKRVFSLGDRKLSEVFSEGERKIHSLADFFTQTKLRNYKGIYIFDDPVTSLDEDHIELVAFRICKLVEEGNQVIIFTHNRYFLNCLINIRADKIVRVFKSSSKVYLQQVQRDEFVKLKSIMYQIDREMEYLSKKNSQDINTFEIGGVYDLISKYLEDYVESHLFKSIVSRHRPNIRMDSLIKLEISKEQLVAVHKLYNTTSRKGNRHSQTDDTPSPKYEELVESVKELKEKFSSRN